MKGRGLRSLCGLVSALFFAQGCVSVSIQDSLSIEGDYRLPALEKLKKADAAAQARFIPDLLEALRSGDYRLRFNACEAAAVMDPEAAAPAIEPLIDAAAGDSASQVSSSAGRALQHLTGGDPRTLARLTTPSLSRLTTVSGLALPAFAALAARADKDDDALTRLTDGLRSAQTTQDAEEAIEHGSSALAKTALAQVKELRAKDQAERAENERRQQRILEAVEKVKAVFVPSTIDMLTFGRSSCRRLDFEIRQESLYFMQGMAQSGMPSRESDARWKASALGADEYKVECDKARTTYNTIGSSYSESVSCGRYKIDLRTDHLVALDDNGRSYLKDRKKCHVP